MWIIQKFQNNSQKKVYKILLLLAKSYHKHLWVAYDRHGYMVHSQIILILLSKLGFWFNKEFLIVLNLSARKYLSTNPCWGPMLTATWFHNGYSCTDMSRAYLTIPSKHTFAAEHCWLCIFIKNKLCIIICAIFVFFYRYDIWATLLIRFPLIQTFKKTFFVLLQLIGSKLLCLVRSLNKPNFVGKILDTIYFESQYHSINSKISAKYYELGT